MNLTKEKIESVAVIYHLQHALLGEETIPQVRYQGTEAKPENFDLRLENDVNLTESSYDHSELAAKVQNHYGIIENKVREQVGSIPVTCRIDLNDTHQLPFDRSYAGQFVALLREYLGEEKVRYEEGGRSGHLARALQKAREEKPPADDITRMDRAIEEIVKKWKN